MGKAATIIRTSIFIFLKNYLFFTSTPSLLALPFALSTLFSTSLVSSSYLFPLLHARLRSLFLAAGLPPSSELFPILNFKLSQTILSSLFVSPFTLSFLLLAKASIIRELQTKQKSFISWVVIFKPILITQFCNLLVILSANATCLCFLFLAFNCFEVLGLLSRGPLLLLSATGAIIYSIVLANAYIICNLSSILSGQEKHRGFTSILKACLLIKGRTAIALSLAVPMNMGLAGIDALFQYRIMKSPNSSMAWEAMLIAYMYAMLIVLDTIVGSEFLKGCRLLIYPAGQESHHDDTSVKVKVLE